jgi:HEAT repeat protein
MNGRALLIAVALAVAAPSGRPDEAAKAQKVAKADHVVVKFAGKSLAGWLLDPAAKDGSIYLDDDGTFVTVAKDAKSEVVETTARPVTEVPGPPLVDGLGHAEEGVRDRCQELLAQRGEEAAPLLAAALDAKSAEARRRALTILTATKIDSLAKSIKICVNDSDERVRAVALEAFAKLRKDEALPICVDRLENDGSPLVQHSAAERIGGLGDYHGVDPLLDHLGRCEDRGVRIAVFAALRRISGKNLGRDEEAWRAWWTNHKDELLPDDDEK